MKAGALIAVLAAWVAAAAWAGGATHWVTLAWENAAVGRTEDYETCIEASTNLVEWVEVAVVAYATSNVVTLSNRPGAEFYRAANRLRESAEASEARCKR